VTTTPGIDRVARILAAAAALDRKLDGVLEHLRWLGVGVLPSPGLTQRIEGLEAEMCAVKGQA
jgi:hypothetical protein